MALPTPLPLTTKAERVNGREDEEKSRKIGESQQVAPP